MSDIDAPEKRKRGYQKAKEMLRRLIKEEELIIAVEGESYGRKVVKARRLDEKTTINTKMRRKGY